MAIGIQRVLTGFVSPEDVAIRDDGARIAVVETNRHSVRWAALPAAGTFTAVGAYVNGAGAGFAFPEAAAFDNAQRLVVLDLWNRRVVRYAPQGAGYAFDAAYGPAGGLSAGGVGLGYARDLALDSAGVLYVLDSEHKRIVRAGTGAPTAIPLPSQIVAPWGLALRSAGGFLVVDRGSHRVYALSAAGTVDFQLGVYGRAEGQLRFPEHVAVAPSGNIWVADTDNGRIQEFAPSGAFIRVVLAAEQFRQIRRLRFAPNGWLYIADPGAGAVHEVADAVPKKAVYVSPIRVSFRDTDVGSVAQANVKISNVGSDAVQLSAVSTSGAPFSHTVSGATPRPLQPGATESATVRFAPQSPGAANGLLTVDTDAIQNIRTVRLLGTGLLVPHMSVGFVVDRSISMNGRFREIVKLNLVKHGFSVLPWDPPVPPVPPERSVKVGLVYFNDTASIGLPLTSVHDGGLAALARALDHMPRPRGMTSLGAGLEAGFELLRGSDDDHRALVLVTGAHENAAPWIDDVDVLDGVAVHAIGLGSGDDVGARELDLFCRKHCGSLRLTGTAFDRVPRLLAEVGADLAGSEIVMSRDVSLQGREVRIPVNVCSSDHRLRCLLSWSDPALAYDVQLLAPGGERVESAVLERDVEGKSSRVLLVSLPARVAGRRRHAGTWTLVVRRAGGRSAAAADLQLAVTADSDLRLSVDRVPSLLQYGLDRERAALSVGDDVSLAVSLRDRGEPREPDFESASVLRRPEAAWTDGAVSVRRARKLLSDSPSGAAAALSVRAALARAASHDGVPPDGSSLRAVPSPLGVDESQISAGIATAPGAYTFEVRIRGHAHDGRVVTRERTVSLYVDPELAIGNSLIELRPMPGAAPVWRLSLTPHDRFGRALGPGWSDAFAVTGETAIQLGAISDRGDGAYVLDFAMTAGEATLPDRLQMQFLGSAFDIVLPPLVDAGDGWRNEPAAGIEAVLQPTLAGRAASEE